MSDIYTFKAGKKSYAVVPVYSSSGKTCRLIYLTAGKNKDLKEWESKLARLDSPYAYHHEYDWEMEEYKKFWEDWIPIWSHRGPGETEYNLFVNRYDHSKFLYSVWDVEPGWHTGPGRYDYDLALLDENDTIYYKDGIWRDYEVKAEKIKDLLKDIDIKQYVEDYLKWQEEERRRKEEEERRKREEKEELLSRVEQDKTSQITIRDVWAKDVLYGVKALIENAEGKPFVMKECISYPCVYLPEKEDDLFRVTMEAPEHLKALGNAISKAWKEAIREFYEPITQMGLVALNNPDWITIQPYSDRDGTKIVIKDIGKKTENAKVWIEFEPEWRDYDVKAIITVEGVDKPFFIGKNPSDEDRERYHTTAELYTFRDALQKELKKAGIPIKVVLQNNPDIKLYEFKRTGKLAGRFDMCGEYEEKDLKPLFEKVENLLKTNPEKVFYSSHQGAEPLPFTKLPPQQQQLVKEYLQNLNQPKRKTVLNNEIGGLVR